MKAEKHHILYVDDEENNLNSFKAAFRPYYQIHTATGAREGIRILREHPVHVIVTDQRMPEMTGVQFFEAIIPEYPDAIRMILTGFSDVEAIIKAINTGRVYRYITKPWDEAELKLTIDGAINFYNLQRRNRELVQELQDRVQEQEKVMKLFQKYVPENVVSDTLNIRAGHSLFEGESRIISVLFADIRNFTRLSSTLEPRQVVSLLNDYFSMLNASIKRHKGTVNKFIGDGMLAVFGAPMSYLENQANAVLCALDMVDRLTDFNALHAETIGQEIQIGIGISTGEAIVGNIGSDDRVEYTAIGDPVSIATRIESMTKLRPNTVLISEQTEKIVRDDFNLERIEPEEEGGLVAYQVLGAK